MSPKYAVSFFLLALVCSADFISAFNSERLHSEDIESIEKQQDEKNIEVIAEHKPLNTVHKSLNHQETINVAPDHPAEPHPKRVKVVKRRHVRKRRDRFPELPTDVQQIFSSNQVRRSINPNDFMASFQQQQQYPWQFQGYPSATPFNNPNAFHSTFVPNGPQVNNYYSAYTNPLSPSGPNVWHPQGPAPWSYPNTPYFVFIPVPWCLPVPQTPNTVDTPSTGGNTNVTVEDRFSFPEEIPTGGTRPNTMTGISLDIATPPRRPSRPLPPIQRNPSDGSILSSGEGKISGQVYNPPIMQRPQMSIPSINPTTSGPTSIFGGSNSIGQSPQVGANVPPCLWAIVSCCQNNKSNQRAQENCFDNLGCSGAFYDRNPCDGELARAAQQAAQNFYNSG